jgi:hypothetical protein
VQQAFFEGQPIVLPARALGPCFARTRTRFAETELGFEYEAGSALVTRVDENSPAFSVGLRSDVRLERILHTPYDTRRPIRVYPAGQAALEYFGRVRSVAGVGYERVPGVRDEDCAQQ